jgi:uncharacterized protein (TIGR02246 family)
VTADESDVRAVFERWNQAVRDENIDAILRDHADDFLMFDVVPPAAWRGLAEYAKTWRMFFANAVKPVAFDFTDVAITAGSDVAFVSAIGHCVTLDEPVEFRLTMCLRKREGRWIVTHEHHSVPV